MFASRVWKRSSAALIALFVPLAVAPVWAGNRDSHLTATHYLALHLGVSDDDAQTLAMANWSMDLANSTTALPVAIHRGVLYEPTDPDTKSRWHARGASAHSLQRTPEAVLKRLNELKHAAENPEPNIGRQRQMMYLGQYLHALQDAFFHQKENGQPYESVLGHALTAEGGHKPDKVVSHFPAAVRAYQATYQTLRVLKDADKGGDKAVKLTLPDPASFRIYAPPEQVGRSLQETNGHVILLAAAIAKAYKVETVQRTVTTGGLDVVVVPTLQVSDNPDPERLKRNLDDLWARAVREGLVPPNASFSPVFKSKGEKYEGLPQDAGPARFDYDLHPEYLSRPLREPGRREPDGTLKVIAAGANPGGISFSAAAVLGFPIEFDLDSLSYDVASRSIVVSGRQGGKRQRFDAALFMTAFRLACERSDPYFSLDPAEISAYHEQSRQALAELSKQAQAIVPRAAPVAEQDLPAGPGQFRIERLEAFSYSLQEREAAQYKQLLGRFPALQPRLVFRPQWLGETRFGKILYDADVALKELAEGLAALRPGEPPAVVKLERYLSPRLRKASRRLVENLRQRAPELGVTQMRLWFDLAEAPDAPQARSDPAARPAPQARSPLEARIAAAIEEQLRQKGLLADGAGDEGTDSQLFAARDVQDLSQVSPRMFVRQHEHGRDLASSDLDLDRLTRDVNSRIAAYAEQYREIQDLVQVFRAYVAARKIVESEGGLCEGLRGLPLLPSEKLAEPLPLRHPTPLMSLHGVTADVVYSGEAGGTDRGGRQVYPSTLVTISGGVAVRYELLRQSQVAEPTERMKEIRSAAQKRAPEVVMWSKTGGKASGVTRQFVAFALDLPARLTKFVPVTIEQTVDRLDKQLESVAEKLSVASLRKENEALTQDVGRLRNYIYVISGLLFLVIFAGGILLAVTWLRRAPPARRAAAAPSVPDAQLATPAATKPAAAPSTAAAPAAPAAPPATPEEPGAAQKKWW
jgi:hypothetical protein